MRVMLSDLIDPGLYYKIPQEHQINIGILLYKINVLREASQIPFNIRDDKNRQRAGYRTQDQHRELYVEINKKREEMGLVARRVPTYSRHCEGAASDILDADEKLKLWILKNMKFVEETGVWFEDFSFTDGFCHIQIYPPASMQRFFKP